MQRETERQSQRERDRCKEKAQKRPSLYLMRNRRMRAGVRVELRADVAMNLRSNFCRLPTKRVSAILAAAILDRSLASRPCQTQLDDDYGGFYGGGYDDGYGDYLDHGGGYDDYSTEAAAAQAAEASTVAANAADVPIADDSRGENDGVPGGKGGGEGGASTEEAKAGKGDGARPNSKVVVVEDEGGMGGDTDGDGSEAVPRVIPTPAGKTEKKSTPFKVGWVGGQAGWG